MFTARMSINEEVPPSNSSQRNPSPISERAPSSSSSGRTRSLVNERRPSISSQRTRSPFRVYRQVYEMIPYALQTGLRPLVLVRRSINACSRRSRRRVIGLVMSRSEGEDKAVTRDDVSLASSSSTPGICWKRAYHGEIRHLENFSL